MAAAVSADPYERCVAEAFWCASSSVVVLPLTLLRDVTDVDDRDDDDDDDARIALIPNDSVADDVT